MFVVHSYPLAVVLCVITMLCWGSWANTRKLARKNWRFELFYWDYALGVLLLTLAIVLDATAYRRLPGAAAGLSTKGLVLSVACGVFMGMFYRFVAAAMYGDPLHPDPGKMGPYAAVFVFAVGVFLSNFVW